MYFSLCFFVTQVYVASIIVKETHSYVILSANFEDFKNIAKNLVPDQLIDTIAKVAGFYIEKHNPKEGDSSRARAGEKYLYDFEDLVKKFREKLMKKKITYFEKNEPPDQTTLPKEEPISRNDSNEDNVVPSKQKAYESGKNENNDNVHYSTTLKSSENVEIRHYIVDDDEADKSYELKAETQYIDEWDSEEMEITASLKKLTNMPKRDFYTISTPDYRIKVPVAERYDFNEPIPGREIEITERKSLPVASVINGKVTL